MVVRFIKILVAITEKSPRKPKEKEQTREKEPVKVHVRDTSIKLDNGKYSGTIKYSFPLLEKEDPGGPGEVLPAALGGMCHSSAQWAQGQVATHHRGDTTRGQTEEAHGEVRLEQKRDDRAWCT